MGGGTAALRDTTSKHQPQMYAIRNMVDIWGAKVHKLVTYYGRSNMARGKAEVPANALVKGFWSRTF